MKTEEKKSSSKDPIAYLNPQFPSPDTFTSFRTHSPKCSTTTPGICKSGTSPSILRNSMQEMHIFS